MTETGNIDKRRRKYDVAFSFAGEDRPYVENVASILKRKGIRVFYDKYEEADLWGKDLYTHLREVYSTQARYTVIFISSHYATKLWTNHERESAQARAFEENKEYLLPARFDSTPIPGILRTVGYVDLSEKTPEDLCLLIEQKVANSSGVEVAPAHEIVDIERYDTRSRPDAVLIDISSQNLSQRVVMIPSAYNSFQSLLDDLFIHYLAAHVHPYTYGSEWVLIGEPFHTRIACPVDWVESPHRSVTDLCPLWANKIRPEQEGLMPATYWEVNSTPTSCGTLSQGFNLRKYYGLLTNNPELAKLAVTHAKAIAFLSHDKEHLVPTVLSKVNKNDFKYRFVFRDWLTISPGKILVDRGLEIKDDIRQLFHYR